MGNIKDINVPLVVNSSTLQKDLQNKEEGLQNKDINVPLKSSYTGKSLPKESSYNLDDYQKYFDEGVDPVFKNIDYERALNQSGWEQARRSIGGGLYKGVLGIFKDIGYLADLENNIGRLTGAEEVDTNWWSKIFEDAQKNFDENHPIYRYNPDKVIDWNDPGFYWSAIQGVVESAVEFGGLGAGVGATVGRGAKYLAGLAKLGVPVQNVAATVGTAAVTNYAEGKTMALEMFRNTVDERMQQVDKDLYDRAFQQAKLSIPSGDPGQISQLANQIYGSEEYQLERQNAEKQIRSIAGKQADMFQAKNMAFMLSDAIAINGMFRGTGYTRNLLKDKTFKNTALMIAKQAPTEYFEEVGQGVLQKEGEYQAMKEAGMDVSEISSDPVKRTWQFISDEQTQLEGLMGLFGGPIQHVLVQSPMNLSNRTSDAEYRDNQAKQIKENEQLLNGLLAQQGMYEKAKQDAIINGDEAAFEYITKDQFKNTAYQNFAKGTTEDLESKLQDVANMSPEEAAEQGYDENYKENAENRIQQLKDLEKSYLKIISKHGGEKDYLIHKKLYDIENNRNSITEILGTLKQEKSDLLNNIQQEVQTLEDITISQDQMKLQDLNMRIKSLGEQKAKLTATKNDQLTLRNVKLENARKRYEDLSVQYTNAQRYPYKFDKAYLQELSNQLDNAKAEYNRLSRYDSPKTKNQRLIDKVERNYNKQYKKLEQETDRLSKERDQVKNTLKENNEKVEAFNTDNYNKWEELSDVQSRIDNFTTARGMLDNEYNDITKNKNKYISDFESVLKEDTIDNIQKDIDNAETPEAKRQIIAEQDDPEIKEELNKRNERNIQKEERDQRVEQAKETVQQPTEPTPTVEQEQATQQFTVRPKRNEEVETDETLNKVGEQVIIDDGTIEDVKDEVDATQQHVQEQNYDIKSVEKDKVEYGYSQSEKGFNLLAYLSRLYKTVVNGNKVDKEEITNELNESTSTKVLNPNKYNAGTNITLRPTTNGDIIINVETGQTWGDFSRDLDVNSDEYINTIPVEVVDNEGDVIGYLHQDSWINEENIFGDVAENKENLKTIRKKIIQDGTYETTIKSKSIGYLFRNKDGAVTTSTAIKDPNVIYAVGGYNELFSDSNLNNLQITNKDRIQAGTTYMIVKVGQNDTGDLYTAVPLLNKRMNEVSNSVDIINSIQNAIRIYYNSNTIGRTEDENAIYNQLGKEGYDLSTLDGLTKYVNQFIQVFYNKGESISKAAKARYKNASEKTLLSIDKQQIQFLYNNGRTGFINVNNTNSEQFGTALAIIGQSILPNMYSNIDKDSIINNKSVKLITSKDGVLQTKDLYEKYSDLVKDNTLTDIISHIVDKDEQGNNVYTYTIQPKIEIDFSEIIGEDTETILDDKERVDKTVVSKEQPSDEYEQYDEGSFSVDPTIFGDEFPDIDYLPGLEDKFVNEFKIQVSDIIIENLDTSKQEAFVDILFKDALLEILRTEGEVNVNPIFERLFKEVESNLEVQSKNIEIAKRNLTKAQSKNDENAIQRFERDIKYRESISDLFQIYLKNKDRLIQLANNKLKAESIIDQNIGENGILNDDENQDNEKIYDLSSYQENRDKKASKFVKRFLASVRDYNQDGTVKKNLLGRETFMSYEDVYKQLQVITSNIEPDYKIILARIKSLQNTFPFFKDVISKLEDESNPNIEIIRKQLTVLLTNHYSNSKFALYGKDKNDKPWTQIKSSNSNSVEESIRDGWDSLFMSTDLVEVDENNNQIINVEKANELIEQLNDWKKNIPESATPEVRNWLGQFGIILSDNTWKDLEEGKYEYAREKFNTWKELFTNNKAPFNVLANQYLKGKKGATIDTNIPTNESVVKNLAKLEGKYSYIFHSNSHREGVKTVYSYGTNKLLTDVVRDFHKLEESEDSDGNKVYTNKLITDKIAAVFNNKSQWLRDMIVLDENNEPKYADNGQVIINPESVVLNNLDFFTVSLEAIKQQGQSSRDNRELNKLSEGEIEFTKLIHLTSSIPDQTGNNNRIVNILYPTTSDKSTVMGLTTKAFDIKYDFETANITDETVDSLYDILVLPEIERILHINELVANETPINFEDKYIEGAQKFLVLAELNNPIKIDGTTYNLFNTDGTLNENIQVEYKDVIREVIRRYVDQLVNDKLQVWKDNGIIAEDNSNILISQDYFNKFSAVADTNRAKGIATDMVIQYLAANMNSFQTFIGDPALYYSKNINNTWINIGKRLAADIAPGEQGDGTMNNTYKQVFVKDRLLQSKVYEQLKKLLGDKADAYLDINSTDAQEYTTLLEKLYVMNMHGRIEMKGLYNKVHNIITRELSKDTPNTNYIKELQKELTKEEYDYLRNLTLQPDKPVYVKNIVDKELGIERRVYIKSSSFALSPFLTTGTELDKLRTAMETKGISRLAYESAVKVGNVNKPVSIWNEDGSIVDEIDFNDNSILTLPRTGFRIQQDVPYNPLKESINKVSQASKNLFVNMLDIDGFKVDWLNEGEEVKGSELQKEYLKLYKNLFQLQEQELFEELEYNPDTGELNVDKLRQILVDEGIKRNYPLADLHTFDLDTELRLLAFSPSASKYEALLNSLVTNRIIKMKFPGKSYVLGSEAGFSVQAFEDTDITQYDIVWTDKFNGKELFAADGSGRPDQVIMPWDFKDDIEKYVGKDGLLNLNKLPEELLQRFGMRIPNQGPNSQSKVEVAGFFKGNVGDLLIAPKEFVVRMGSDFDVDKLYVYKYAYYLDKKAGKIKRENITREKAEELYNRRTDSDVDILLKAMLGEEEVERIFNADKETFIRSLIKASEFNKILDIHLAIHSNPDSRVQKQIHQPLDFWRLDSIGETIEGLKPESNKLFTGLSDEYQKNTFIDGSVGKSLVGVFSNDSMFNALVQGKDIRLLSSKKGESFEVRFGNKVSTGDLSNPYTLDTQRKLDKNPDLNINELEYKSDVIAGYQSAAVDHAKEQILNKINVNTETASVVKVLSQLGFTKETPYFLSQPIIVEYVKELKRLRGLGDFVSNVENRAYSNVMANYKADTTNLSDEFIESLGDSKLTINKMSDMIEGKSVENYELTQRAVLNKYLQLKKYGGTLSKIQSTLNLDSQGLGKSYFDTLIREEDLDNLKANVANFESLMNDELTIPGMAITHGLKVNNRLWRRFLPFDKPAFRQLFQTLEKIYSKNEAGRASRSEFRNKVWNELKKFRFSDPNLFIPDQLDDQGNKINTAITDPNYIDNERRRLFIHTKDNKSLARRVYEAKNKYPNNLFLNFLQTEVVKGGLHSKVKFRASNRDLAKDETMYAHFTDLLVNDRVISEEYNISPKYRMSMNFEDGTGGRTMRSEFKGKSTMDLILSGDRTATSRDFSKEYNNKNIKVGDIIEFKDKFGKKALVQVTKAPYSINNINKAEWSKLEGWSESVYDNLNDSYKQFQYKLVDKNIVGTDTTRDLFQDLVWGAYLDGGIQGAWEYIKYIPTTYLHLVPFANNIVNWLDNVHTDPRILLAEDDKNIIPNAFIKQHVQNNPEGLPKVEDSHWIKYQDKLLYNGPELGLKNESPKYLSMYDKNTPLGQKNFRLFERVGETKNNKGVYYPEYVEIPILGTSGRDKVSEYNYLRNDYSKTVFGNDANKEYKSSRNNTVSKGTATGSTKYKPQMSSVDVNLRNLGLFDTTKNKITGAQTSKNALNYIKNHSTNPYFRKVSELLLNNFDKYDLKRFGVRLVPNLTNQFGANSNGQVRITNDGVTIMSINNRQNGNHVNMEQLQHTFLHEFIHVITKKQLDNPKTTLQKQVVKDINNLLKQTRDVISSDERYAEKYNKFKQGNRKITSNDDYIFYALENTKDFIALSLGNEHVQKVLNEITIKDKSVLQRFIDNIIKLLKEIGFDIKQDTVAYAAIDSTMKLLLEPTQTKEFNIKTSEKMSQIYNKYYEGNIKPSPNTIFVFGSNLEGRHGAGAAKIAREQFGAVYGQGEGLQGNSYALPTKDLRVKENKGFKSISPEQITQNIEKLYEAAKQNPNKQFKIAYRNTTKKSLNGYTGLEMIEMFNNAGIIPSNIIFSKEWFDTGKLSTISSPNNQFGLFDNEGRIIEEFLPEFVPSSREIMRQFKELNSDGSPKILSITDDNYRAMVKRAQTINNGQSYYKATVGETMGENISTRSKKFYRIYLQPRKELNNIEYLADLVPNKYIEEMRKQCK